MLRFLAVVNSLGVTVSRCRKQLGVLQCLAVVNSLGVTASRCRKQFGCCSVSLSYCNTYVYLVGYFV